MGLPIQQAFHPAGRPFFPGKYDRPTFRPAERAGRGDIFSATTSLLVVVRLSSPSSTGSDHLNRVSSRFFPVPAILWSGRNPKKRSCIFLSPPFSYESRSFPPFFPDIPLRQDSDLIIRVSPWNSTDILGPCGSVQYVNAVASLFRAGLICARSYAFFYRDLKATV